MNTQTEAYIKMQGTTDTIRTLILKVLEEAPEGLVQDEIVSRVNEGRTKKYRDDSIKPRISELVDAGHVRPAGFERSAPSTGYMQQVWRIRQEGEDRYARTIGTVVAIRCSSPEAATELADRLKQVYPGNVSLRRR